jgi:hypothetical protein
MSELRERLDRELATITPSVRARAEVERRLDLRARRRRVAVPVTALLIAAAIFGGLTYAFRSVPPTAPADVTSIPMPGEPFQAIVDGDALWALTTEPGCDGPTCRGFVVKVDTVRGGVTAEVPVTSPLGLTAGAGSIWVASFSDATLIRLDPETAEIEATIPLVLPGEELGSDWKFLPTNVDANDDGVWVSTARGAVAHIDPATNRVVDVVPLPPATLGGVAIGQHAIWLDNGLGGLIRVDPETHEVQEEGSIDDENGRRLSVGTPVARGGTLWLVGGWGRAVDGLDGVTYEATERQALVRVQEASGEVASILNLPKEAWWAFLLEGDDPWLVEGAGSSLRRIDPFTGSLGEPIAVPFGHPLAVSGTTAWSAVGESIRSWELPGASGDAGPVGQPDSEGAMCDFPSVRPTYLPWVAPGEPVGPPGTDRWAGGGGPQGLDPGYSILSWSNGDVTMPGHAPDVGSVSLWRATESVGSFPVDPEVPPLPDGSTGRFYASEGGGGDWSIIWGDPLPDVTDDDCSETALVVNFPNLTRSEAKREIIRIAESLVSP